MTYREFYITQIGSNEVEDFYADKIREFLSECDRIVCIMDDVDNSYSKKEPVHSIDKTPISTDDTFTSKITCQLNANDISNASYAPDDRMFVNILAVSQPGFPTYGADIYKAIDDLISLRSILGRTYNEFHIASEKYTEDKCKEQAIRNFDSVPNTYVTMETYPDHIVSSVAALAIQYRNIIANYNTVANSGNIALMRAFCMLMGALTNAFADHPIIQQKDWENRQIFNSHKELHEMPGFSINGVEPTQEEIDIIKSRATSSTEPVVPDVEAKEILSDDVSTIVDNVDFGDSIDTLNFEE